MATKRRIVPTDYADLATALGAANNGDEIVVLESGSPYTGANNRGLDPAGLDPLLIKSQRGEHRTTIDPENADRAFLFDNGESRNVVLDGFLIWSGDVLGAGDGGIILIDTTSNPTIKNCIIAFGGANNGGGIAIDGGSDPLLENLYIVGNAVGASGGGVYVGGASEPIINNCTIRSNNADDGGGIAVEGNSTATMTNCIIWANSAATSANEIFIVGAGDTINLNYSDYSNGAGDVVNNGTFNTTASISTDPVFVAGPNGGVYLSQIAAGQGADSPCLGTGTGTVGTPGDYINDMWRRTTRTDEYGDTGTLNMGYHFRGVYISGIPKQRSPKLRWKPVHLILAEEELGAESAVGGERLDLRKKTKFAITVKAAFHADATGDLRICVRSSPDDDDNIGTYDGSSGW